MTTNESMDRLLRKLTRQGLNTATASLYIEGVKAKLRAARFAVENLRVLEHIGGNDQAHGDTTVQTTQSVTIDDKVNFYCECFWDFLRSSLDILAQLVNELHPSLNMNEKKVHYKQVANVLKNTEQGTPLEQAVSNCRRSESFKNLEEYRHCSMHRRQVFIETRTYTTRIAGTRGYYEYAGTSRTTVERFICRNPWDLQPRVDNRRPLVEYCECLLQSIERRISTIISRLP